MKRKEDEDEHFNLFMCIKKLDSKSQLLLSTIFSLQLLKQQSEEIGFLCPKGLPRNSTCNNCNRNLEKFIIHQGSTFTLLTEIKEEKSFES